MPRSKNALKYNVQWRRLLEYFDGRYNSTLADELDDTVEMKCGSVKKAKSLKFELDAFLKAVQHTANGLSGLDEISRKTFSDLKSTSYAIKSKVEVPGVEKLHDKMEELMRKGEPQAKIDDVAEKIKGLPAVLLIWDARETAEGDLVDGFNDVLANLGNKLIKAQAEERREEAGDEILAIRGELGGVHVRDEEAEERSKSLDEMLSEEDDEGMLDFGKLD